MSNHFSQPSSTLQLPEEPDYRFFEHRLPDWLATAKRSELVSTLNQLLNHKDPATGQPQNSEVAQETVRHLARNLARQERLDEEIGELLLSHQPDTSVDLLLNTTGPVGQEAIMKFLEGLEALPGGWMHEQFQQAENSSSFLQGKLLQLHYWHLDEHGRATGQTLSTAAIRRLKDWVEQSYPRMNKIERRSDFNLEQARAHASWHEVLCHEPNLEGDFLIDMLETFQHKNPEAARWLAQHPAANAEFFCEAQSRVEDPRPFLVLASRQSAFRQDPECRQWALREGGQRARANVLAHIENPEDFAREFDELVRQQRKTGLQILQRLRQQGQLERARTVNWGPLLEDPRLEIREQARKLYAQLARQHQRKEGHRGR